MNATLNRNRKNIIPGERFSINKKGNIMSKGARMQNIKEKLKKRNRNDTKLM